MPTWDSSQYLKFGDERTQPSIDLAARIRVEHPRRVIDLGCGPGNSTTVLARRWPQAEITGLDSSSEMIATARQAQPQIAWSEGDIAAWTSAAPFDVVFSNAALQWLPHHATLLPRLLDQVAPGGALAVQMPANYNAPPHRLMRELSQAPAWRDHFTDPVRNWSVETPGFYYDTLAPRAVRLDLWLTDYQHILHSLEDILEWYRGTGLRPYLEALKTPAEKAQFEREFLAGLTAVYPQQKDGRVLFPFRRLFFIAYC